uniref:Membrane protein BRI3 n=2 Tax=Passeriformes TaxID=9126 RepID=A0A8C5IQQ9_JUNHY
SGPGSPRSTGLGERTGGSGSGAERGLSGASGTAGCSRCPSAENPVPPARAACSRPRCPGHKAAGQSVPVRVPAGRGPFKAFKVPCAARRSRRAPLGERRHVGRGGLVTGRERSTGAAAPRAPLGRGRRRPLPPPRAPHAAAAAPELRRPRAGRGGRRAPGPAPLPGRPCGTRQRRPSMDSKPLLQERPPAYSPAAPGAPGYDYGHGNYGAIPAPQPGFQPPPPYSYPGAAAAPGYAVPPPTSQPNYSSTYTIIQQPATTTSVVVVGGCPACRVGVLEDTFTCLGVLCAIVFFPIGILFCLALRQRRCPNCGAAFG